MSTHAVSTAVLHIWPKTESFLSMDPHCVATLLYLQIYIPGQFTVQYCTNPDLSPSGQLPYFTHGLHSVTGFHAISKHVTAMARHDPVASLTSVQKAQISAHVAYVESSLGDLTDHVFYALSANWSGKTRPALVSMLPVPQRYYLPERIRLSHQPRLEAAELWSVSAIEQEEKGEREKFSFRRPARKTKKMEEKAKAKTSFERTKVLNKAIAVLDIYVKLLGDARFFYRLEKPSTLDVLLAAHIYVLKQDQPDMLIADLLKDYPTLLAHADLLYRTAFPDSFTFPIVVPSSTGFSLRALMPRSVPKDALSGPKSSAVEEQERKFARIRYAFFGGALLVAGGYIYWQRFAFIRLAYVLQQAASAVDETHEDAAAEEVEELEGEDDD